MIATMNRSVANLSNNVATLHETVRHMRPDTNLERLRNIALTLAGILVSAASFVWLYDRIMHP